MGFNAVSTMISGRNTNHAQYYAPRIMVVADGFVIRKVGMQTVRNHFDGWKAAIPGQNVKMR